MGPVCVGIALSVFANAETAQTQAPSGVVLVAHGSNNPQLSCNGQVQTLYDEIRNDTSLPPLKYAFLRFENGYTLEKTVADLKNDGINDNILFIHLAPSSFSIRHRELKQVHAPSAPGFVPNPPGHVEKHWLYKTTMRPRSLPAGKKYAVSPAMDDNPLIVQILSEYAAEIFNTLRVHAPSTAPEQASLLLVSYGAIEELENILWDRVMEGIGETIRSERGFKEVACISLRNHSADLIREQSVRNLIKTAKRLKEQGAVIVVPYVLCDGAFHESLRSYLTGIVAPDHICSKGIITHPNTALWVKEVIQQGMNQPSGPDVNRNWSLMDIETGRPIGTHKYGFYENP